MTKYEKIVQDLKEITTEEWVQCNPVPPDNEIFFSDEVRVCVYRFSYPVVRMFFSETEWLDVSLNQLHSYITTHLSGQNFTKLDNVITEEGLFQRSLVDDLGELTFELFQMCLDFGNLYWSIRSGYKSDSLYTSIDGN